MTRQLNYSKIIVATPLVGLGFYLVSNVNHFISIPYIGYFSFDFWHDRLLPCFWL